MFKKELIRVFLLVIMLNGFFLNGVSFSYAVYWGGEGTDASPYEITNCSDLSDIGNSTDTLNDYYILTDNIDCSDTINWNGGEGFDPIGSLVSEGFTGNFYGNSYSISDLFINRKATNHSMVGLFCNISHGNVSNVNLVGVEINGSLFVGGLTGYANSSFVDNVYVQGNVTAEGTVGGLVGKGSNLTIEGSYTSVNVTAVRSANAGGLVGYNLGVLDGNSSITNSYANESVTSNNDKVGGLVGWNYGKYGDVNIDNCYATGSVTGAGTDVGGLVGYNNGYTGDANISNSYATGNVIGGAGDVGGLVGENQGNTRGTAIIDNCYATGNVTGGDHVGGLVGFNYGYMVGGDANISNSYATGNVTGTDIYVGGLVGFNLGYYGGYATVDNSYWYNDTEDGLICVGVESGTSTVDCGNITSINWFYDFNNVPTNSWLFPPWDNFCNNQGYPSLSWQNIVSYAICGGDDITAPDIALDGPENFFNETATGNVTFNYTASDVRSDLDTCELWGNWTSSGWHLNESFVNPSEDATNGSSNVTIEDGLYVWSVYCNDTLNNYNNSVDNFTLTVDLTSPNITLDVPGDWLNSSNSSVIFNYTASDIVSDVDTCELWGNWTSSGWHLNETFVSPPKDATNGSSNVTIEDGLYVWSVYCNDTLGNNNVTNINYTLTIDTTAIVVTLDAPSDNSYDVDGDVNFSFTAVETNPDKCTLWFRSNVTNWAQNDSTAYSNGVQANIFVNLTDAVYVWNFECNDTSNNPAFASANRTLTVDTVVPVKPTLTAPTDTSINPRDSISYSCQSSDVTAGISKWTWTLTKPQSGGTVTKTGGEFTSNTQTFSGDDTNLAGSYTVVCEVEDKAGHKSSSSGSFSVYYSHVSEGAGGAGAGPSAAAQLDFTIQEEVKIKEPQGAIMTFTLDGIAVHTIRLRTVDVALGRVLVVIESDPIEVWLYIGETKEVDVDGDGISDISVTLNGIGKNGWVDLTTKRLAPLPVEKPVKEVILEEEPEEVMPPAEESPSKAWLWMLIIVILAVICIGYFVLKKKGYDIVSPKGKKSSVKKK